MKLFKERILRIHIWAFLFATLVSIVLSGCTESIAPTGQGTPATSTGTAVQGNKADVLYVRAVQASDGTWTFTVTVQHPDTGWDNYADGWGVVTPEGTVLLPKPDIPFTRRLEHPHVNEQPFTRSQSGIVIPPGVERVQVRAHSLVGGFGGREVTVALTAISGSDFEVEPLDKPADTEYGFTHQRADGNRLAAGAGSLPASVSTATDASNCCYRTMAFAVWARSSIQPRALKWSGRFRLGRRL